MKNPHMSEVHAYWQAMGAYDNRDWRESHRLAELYADAIGRAAAWEHGEYETAKPDDSFDFPFVQIERALAAEGEHIADAMRSATVNAAPDAVDVRQFLLSARIIAAAVERAGEFDS